MLSIATLSPWTLSGAIALNDAATISSSSEGFVEHIDTNDDIDGIDAMIGEGISIAQAGFLFHLLDIHHNSPLRLDSTRWCPRGPPFV